MATYPIIHRETGETKVIEVSVHEITRWYEEHPEWQRNWSEGCAVVGEVGEWKDKLRKSKPGWNEVLQKAEQAPSAVQKFNI